MRGKIPRPFHGGGTVLALLDWPSFSGTPKLQSFPPVVSARGPGSDFPGSTPVCGCKGAVAAFSLITIGHQTPLLLVGKATLWPQQFSFRANVAIRLRLKEERAGRNTVRRGCTTWHLFPPHAPQEIDPSP